MPEDVASELKKVLNLEQVKDEEQSVDAKIFFDGRQYTIRIPARIAQLVGVDAKKDVFRLTFHVSRAERKPITSLKGELVRK